MNWAICAMTQRIGLYWHLAPTYKQGRKIVWDGFTTPGRKFLDHFPKGLIKGVRQDLMKVELVNGSIYQVVGTDDIDSLVGSNPVGIIVSEYSLQNPGAWELLSPILAENGGWAIFVYTPRGRNHGFDLLENAKDRQDWFTQVLTIEDTAKTEDGENIPVITQEMIEQEREMGTDEETIQQEYYCSFDSSLRGAYYSDHMMKALKEGRIDRAPYEPALPVHTAWDLGRNDQTAIWFVQLYRREVRLIDYHESKGQSLDYYIKLLKDRPYIYGQHLAPHDIGVTEYSTGVSRIEFARGLGINFIQCPKLAIADGIQGVRELLNRCWFNLDKTQQGIECLRQYQKVWDDKKKVFKDQPLHNWASDGADAFRTLAVGMKFIQGRNTLGRSIPRTQHARTEYDPRKSLQSVAKRNSSPYNPR